MEYEIAGTLKLPTLSFDDEKLVVTDKLETKTYKYDLITEIHIAYKQLFSNFGALEITYKGKHIVIPYNKRYTGELEKAICKIKDPYRPASYCEDPFERMKKYKEMLDLGIITQEEFETKKKELLDI